MNAVHFEQGSRASSAGSEQPPQYDMQQCVAVIIPCYNQAAYLGEAIETVLTQTHANVEAVVVDDGSTDDTRTVAARYPQVRYIYQENMGLPAARNAGIRETSAPYLVFLDADDRLLPRALETGLRHLLACPTCAFVFGRFSLVDAKGAQLPPVKQRRVPGDYYAALLEDNIIGMHAAVIYRRAALLAVGGFNTALPACEDYDLYLRLARNFAIDCHDQIVAQYRQHGANMSANSALMLKTVQAVLHTQRKQLSNRERRKAYQRGLTVWQEYYGEALHMQIAREVKARQFLPAARGALQLARYARRYLRRCLRGYLLQTRIQDILMQWHTRLPASLQRLVIRRRNANRAPAVGHVRFGDLYRQKPISDQFGFDRGLPIDRYYIEKFLARYSHCIQGRVLEIGDRAYTERYGGGRVTTSDVLHVDAQNPLATIVGDLASAQHIPDNQFDCVILTQTLHLIYDVEAALRTVYRILKPGAVLLATVPGISQISKDEWARTWYWSFTSLAVERILAAAFPASDTLVEAHGNVLAATAFLQGIAAGEVRQADLEPVDRQYQLLITVFARKPGRQGSARGALSQGRS